MVANTKRSKIIISISASCIFFIPKKITDQREFAINCQTNMFTATFTSFFLNPLAKIKYKLIPIKIYKIVQTGPKIHDGGLNEGFVSAAYQVGIAEKVKIEPITPAA